MKDSFGRELNIGDIVFRITQRSKFSRPQLNVYRILDFTPQKIKIGTKCYVDSQNLTKASSENLEINDESNQ